MDLYRRHQKCPIKDRPERTFKSDEGRKGWKPCNCLIHCYGSIAGGKAARRSTGATEWADAGAVVAQWEAAGAATRAKRIVEAAEITTDGRTTVLRGVLAYLAAKGTRNLRRATMAKYKTFCNQLTAFAAANGFVMIDQFTVAACDEFYASWKDGLSSKGKKLERAKDFFDFCLKRKFAKENPFADLEPPIGHTIPSQKRPLTDDELDRIIEAAMAWVDRAWHYYDHCRGVITADMVVAFIMLLTETGLRIGDAATFNVVERTTPHRGGANCFLQTHKTGKPLFVWLSPDLYNRLQFLVSKVGPAPFIAGTLNQDRAGHMWRKRLHTVFATAGIKGHATPHLFRHTFARLQLQNGVQVQDVAEMMGNTPEVVRRYYAQWATERQERLTDIQVDAYERSKKSLWRGRLLVMPARKA